MLAKKEVDMQILTQVELDELPQEFRITPNFVWCDECERLVPAVVIFENEREIFGENIFGENISGELGFVEIQLCKQCLMAAIKMIGDSENGN